jgi:ubiquitin-protein ligase
MENNAALIQSKNCIFNNTQNKSFFKRLKHEFNNMYKLYDDVKICINEDAKNVNVIILEKIFDDNNYSYNKYAFEINYHYPFVCPKVFFNDKNYYDFLTYDDNYIHKQLQDDHCLCCKSLTCSNNWAPSVTLIHIINEIKENVKIKKNIILKVMIDIIKKKYLKDDINLVEWLV